MQHHSPGLQLGVRTFDLPDHAIFKADFAHPLEQLRVVAEVGFGPGEELLELGEGEGGHCSCFSRIRALSCTPSKAGKIWGLVVKSPLAAIIPFFLAGILQAAAQEPADEYFYLFNSTREAVVVVTQNESSGDWSLPVVAKSKEATKVKPGKHASLLAVIRLDGTYFVARRIPLEELVGKRIGSALFFEAAQEVSGQLEYDEETKGRWMVKLQPDDKKTLSLQWDDIKYDPPRKPRLPPRK